MVLEIHISSPAGPLCVVEVADKATRADVTAAIAAETGILPACQRLIHGTRELLPTQIGPLFDLNSGSRVKVVQLSLVRRSQQQVEWIQEMNERRTGIEVAEFLRHAPEGAKADHEVVLMAVAKSAFALQHAAPELRADRRVVLAAMATYGTLQHVAPELRGDREVAFAAVATYGRALEYATPALRADREVVLAAVAKNGYALEFADPVLQADQEVVLAAVATHGCALEFAHADLRADRDVAIAAVTADAFSLQFAAKELKADREVVFAAAANHRRAAIRCASPELAAELRNEGAANFAAIVFQPARAEEETPAVVATIHLTGPPHTPNNQPAAMEREQQEDPPVVEDDGPMLGDDSTGRAASPGLRKRLASLLRSH